MGLGAGSGIGSVDVRFRQWASEGDLCYVSGILIQRPHRLLSRAVQCIKSRTRVDQKGGYDGLRGGLWRSLRPVMKGQNMASRFGR